MCSPIKKQKKFLIFKTGFVHEENRGGQGLAFKEAADTTKDGSRTGKNIWNARIERNMATLQETKNVKRFLEV